MTKMIILISIMSLSSYLTEQVKLSSDDYITDETNELKTLNDGKNVDPNTLEEEYLMLTDIRRVKTSDPMYFSDDKIYKKFDSRIHWPHCKTIGEVHNQGNSLIDLAYATTGALADRICIATNGSYNQLLSTEELISCSGHNYNNHVYSAEAWKYLKSHGVVSGGKYNTKDGCQPFLIPPICELPKNHNKHKCIRYCYGNKSIEYNHDHVKVKEWYVINGRNKVVSVQKEVLAHGPVVAFFRIYDDFFYYKSGVYKKAKTAKFVRFQHAKLIGWGVQNGVDYWLLVNSMGYEWGQNGLFKIKRGTNECYIEFSITGCVPEIK